MQNIVPENRSPHRYFAYLVVFALFLGYALIPILGSNFSRFPGDLGDARLNIYLLEHTYKYASGQDPAFWTAGFFYPHRNVVAYSDCFAGSAMFYIPFRMMGCDRETAFQYWIVVGFALNFAAMTFVLDRRRFRWPAVALGAAVFTFAPVQFTHLGHIQLLYRMPAPLAWYFLDRFLDEYRPSFLTLALLFVSWQFYMSIYIGYFLCLFLAFCVVAVVVERNKSLVARYMAGASRRARLWHAGILASFALSLYPLYAHYSGPTIYRNTAAELMDLLPHPLSYFLGSRGQLMERILGSPITIQSRFPWEHALFVGLLPWVALLAMMTLAIRNLRSLGPQSRRMLFAFWGVFFLTLSVAGVSIYQIALTAAPALTGIRTMTRVVFILLLPFAYLTAAGLELLLAHARGVVASRITIVISLVVFFAFAWETGVGATTTDKLTAQNRVSALERTVSIGERSAKISKTGPILAALWLDKSASDQERQLDAMLAAQDLNVVTLNGYSRFLAPGFHYVSDCQSLADMLMDYPKVLPSFSVQQAAKRLAIAPGGGSCEGYFDGPRSRPHGRLPDDAYSALIAPRCLACPTAPGSALDVRVKVTNLSDRTWPREDISLSARFVRTSDGMALSGFDNRFPIGTDFAPHESKQYVINLTAPAQPGDYRLEVDLVHELITWFSDKGTKRGELSLRVGPVETKALAAPERELK